MDILPSDSLRATPWQANSRIGPREVMALLIAVGLFVWAVLRAF